MLDGLPAGFGWRTNIFRSTSINRRTNIFRSTSINRRTKIFRCRLICVVSLIDDVNFYLVVCTRII